MRDFRATYRLQLGPNLDFDGARELVPYLRDLGVSHLYLSPSLQARRGSTHGYDVVDPRRLSEDLGGESAFRALAAAAHAAGLGILLDIVPNHMAAGDENPYWRDVRLRRQFFDLDPATGRHRRFFDIDDLAGVRQEDPEVFEATHATVLLLVHEGLVDGLRIDHIDGLANPDEYLARLRAAGARHVWVEKILEPGERLRHWPVEGTTGYEFAADATALLVDREAEDALTALWTELSEDARPFRALAREAKLEQARTTFEPEVERLERLWSGGSLEQAVAALPVYRTYVGARSGRVEDADRRALDEAGMDERLRSALLLEEPGHEELVTRFQQTTGSVMAKGVEDTAFYRYLRLLALNEVGGNPGRFGTSVEQVHQANAERARRFPHNLLAGTTHDTKRSADVRARLAALTWIPDEWRDVVARWRKRNERHRSGRAPDPPEEYLVYQTLAGSWPLERERLEEYLVKALREGKRTTSWTDPAEGWEAGVLAFVRRLYGDEGFVADLTRFADRLARLGERAALSELVLRLTAPGVPDIYEGDELWTLALVDPDNRRPVDWEHRRRLLHELRSGVAPDRASVKLYVTWQALALRARRPRSFSGGYARLDVPPGCFAYRRGDDALVVVPIRTEATTAVALPPGDWHDLLAPAREAVGGVGPALYERV